MRSLVLPALLCLALVCGCEVPEPRSRAASGPLRVVSINPSLTAILLALGAGDSLVGIDQVSGSQQPGLAHLPRVGGLFNPSLEAVVALEPDIVIVVPSVEQRDFRGRLAD